MPEEVEVEIANWPKRYVVIVKDIFSRLKWNDKFISMFSSATSTTHEN